MRVPETAWVFDTGPVRHFAVYIPDGVERELGETVEHEPAVRSALDAEWITVWRSDEPDHLVAIEIMIDWSRVTRMSANSAHGIRVTSTVPILCDAIRHKKLTTPMVEHVADRLLESEYHLPFGPGGFRAHVLEHGLLDYAEL